MAEQKECKCKIERIFSNKTHSTAQVKFRWCKNRIELVTWVTLADGIQFDKLWSIWEFFCPLDAHAHMQTSPRAIWKSYWIPPSMDRAFWKISGFICPIIFYLHSWIFAIERLCCFSITAALQHCTYCKCTAIADIFVLCFIWSVVLITSTVNQWIAVAKMFTNIAIRLMNGMEWDEMRWVRMSESENKKYTTSN